MRRLSQCVIACLIIFCFFPVTTLAVEEQENRASDFFMTDSAYLYKTSSTEFDVCFSVTAVEGMDELGVSEIIIERSADGSNWIKVKTYTESSYPELIDYGTGYHGGYVSYSGSQGYYYRAYVVFYAKIGSNVGKLPRYTSRLKL